MSVTLVESPLTDIDSFRDAYPDGLGNQLIENPHDSTALDVSN